MSTEQAMLELAEDFKNRIEKKNSEIIIVKTKLLEARKHLVYAYSMIKKLDIDLRDDNIVVLVPSEKADTIFDITEDLSNIIQPILLSDVGNLSDDDQ